MTETKYYICYENSLKQDEAELLHKYWLLDQSSENIYRYKVQDLIGILNFNKESAVTKFVKGNCFISSNSQTFNCTSCQVKFNANCRTELNNLIKRLPKVCDNCKKEEVNLIALEKINILESSIQQPIFPEFSYEDLQTLNYVEKIALFVMFSEMNVSENEPINFSEGELNLTGAPDIDKDILSSLFNKKAIYVIKDEDYNNLPLLIEMTEYIYKNKKHLNSDNINLLNLFLSGLYEPGVYFLKPTDSPSFEDFLNQLFEEISNYFITKKDIEILSDIITSILLYQSYHLVNEAKQEHKIPIDMNMKLDIVLTSLVKKYPMPVVFNILNYQAKNVAAKLYSNTAMPSYIQNKLYCKYIEEYINYLDKNNKIPYQKKLPDYMTGSKIEYFSSHYILGDLISWASLSGDDIIERWIHSDTIKNIQ
ncbi:MAG: hypothetical protein ACXVHT_10805 [Methanobacterium sp.]